jgi:hypothetical protein
MALFAPLGLVRAAERYVVRPGSGDGSPNICMMQETCAADWCDVPNQTWEHCYFELVGDGTYPMSACQNPPAHTVFKHGRNCPAGPRGPDPSDNSSPTSDVGPPPELDFKGPPAIAPAPKPDPAPSPEPRPAANTPTVDPQPSPSKIDSNLD